MSDQEQQQDLKKESKNELQDTTPQKASLAKRGSGAIVILAALVLVFYMLNPFSSKEKSQPAQQETITASVEPKVFNPVNEQVSPFNFQSEQTYNNDPFGSDAGGYEQKPPQIVKGLSSAAITQKTTLGSSQNNANGGIASQDAATQSRAAAAEFRQQAAAMQNQLNTLTAGLSSPSAGGSEGSSYDNTFIENNAVAITAKKSVLDPNLSLDKGTFIPCVLKTAIVSSIAGNIACVVTNDVYSAAGTVLLIEKGSIVQGYFRSGQIQPGMNRLFVIWEEIKTPKQIIINVNAPATDTLGGSGIEGWVDNHYMLRFGGAILLSMIDDAFSAAFNNKDGRDYTMNTRENTVEMANTVLQSTINIPPTLYKNQGDIVGIYVNKDIDFSKVYRLQRTDTRIPKW